jgi:hypothetical protein
MQRLRIVLASLASLFSACATTPPTVVEPEPVAPEPTPIAAPAPPSPPPPVAPPPRTCDMFVKPGVLRRVSLLRVLDAGLPRWLQGVEGDRVLAKRRFQGWLVKSIHPDDPCYQDLDLRPGDVVQKVNGKSIERPEQAFAVVESLRTAPAIVVEHLRDGKPRQLRLSISDE